MAESSSSPPPPIPIVRRMLVKYHSETLTAIEQSHLPFFLDAPRNTRSCDRRLSRRLIVMCCVWEGMFAVACSVTELDKTHIPDGHDL
jgi:hypothetical protein